MLTGHGLQPTTAAYTGKGHGSFPNYNTVTMMIYAVIEAYFQGIK